MIEISHFKQAFHLYQSNQLAMVVIQDLTFMFMNTCQDIPPNVATSTDLNADNLTWLSGQLSAEFRFDEYLGGNAYVCESEADLTAIKGYDQDWFNQHGEWPNVTDKPMVWDVCNTLNTEWAVFGYCWNNAGGAIYYIPQLLWSKARAQDHQALSQA